MSATAHGVVVVGCGVISRTHVKAIAGLTGRDARAGTGSAGSISAVKI